MSPFETPTILHIVTAGCCGHYVSRTMVESADSSIEIKTYGPTREEAEERLRDIIAGMGPKAPPSAP
jgi:uncharacterized protein YfcZ (UPF0381/DUF406 family)